MTHPKPSLDLGYPTPTHDGIPSFSNAEDEADFWDSHSFTEFGDEFTQVEIRVDKNLSSPPVGPTRAS